ncbi:MAG: Gfo/Idh/MocA family oxidoreductase [Thermoproteota archaeon]
MRKVKIGIVGVGIQGEQQLKSFKTIEHAEVLAVADLNEKRAREIGEKYGVPRIYTGFQDLAKDPDVEAVSICTPDHLHKEPALMALENNKHLLVEKPLATNVADAQRIVDEAKKRGLKLMVNFSNRWSPPFRLAKETIEAGGIGRIINAYARLSDTIYVPTEMIKWSDKTNVLWFLGSHVFDLFRWLFNDEAKRVFGVSRSVVLNARGVKTQDFYQAIIEFQNGITAVMENSWILPKGEPFIVDFKMEIFGEKGAVRIDRTHHGSVRIVNEHRMMFPDVYVLPSENISVFLRAGLECFIDCLIHDSTPPVTGEDGLIVTKVISAIIKSSEIGMPVEIS